jgi:hypothetical protein
MLPQGKTSGVTAAQWCGQVEEGKARVGAILPRKEIRINSEGEFYNRGADDEEGVFRRQARGQPLSDALQAVVVVQQVGGGGTIGASAAGGCARVMSATSRASWRCERLPTTRVAVIASEVCHIP